MLKVVGNVNAAKINMFRIACIRNTLHLHYADYAFLSLSFVKTRVRFYCCFFFYLFCFVLFFFNGYYGLVSMVNTKSAASLVL